MRAETSVLVARDDQRIVADGDGEIVAGLRYLAIMADEDPVLVEEVLDLDAIEIRAVIEGLLQRIALAAIAERAEHGLGGGHGISSSEQGCPDHRAIPG